MWCGRSPGTLAELNILEDESIVGAGISCATKDDVVVAAAEFHAKHWRANNQAIQKICVAKAIQTNFSECSDRRFDGSMATNASQAFIWYKCQPSTLNERLGATYSDNAIQTIGAIQTMLHVHLLYY